MKLLGNRYYDPGQARFITRDPVGSTSNWYGYADNNPLNKVDPLGLDAELAACQVELAEMGMWDAQTAAAEGSVLPSGVASPNLWQAVGLFVVQLVQKLLGHKSSPVGGLQAASAKNGNTTAAQKGQYAHKTYRPEGDEPMSKEYRFKDGTRADWVKWDSKVIPELKPDNTRAIRRGQIQGDHYVKQMEKEYPTAQGEKEWTSEVVTYDPSTIEIPTELEWHTPYGACVGRS